MQSWRENENERKGKRKHVCVREIEKEIDREIEREIDREEAQSETDREEEERRTSAGACRTWLCIWLICHCTHAPEPRALRLLRLRS
jgi:hypothetical protein